MASTSGDRSAQFPTIENKYGQPISYWLDQLAGCGSDKYPDQIAWLRENHGFTRAHANTVVMYFRGSTTTRRYSDVDTYLGSIDPGAADTIRSIFAAITAEFPDLEPVIAWNQPILRNDHGYVFGISTASRHLTVNPWSTEALERFTGSLPTSAVKKHTFTVPFGWEIDAEMLRAMVRQRLSEIEHESG